MSIKTTKKNIKEFNAKDVTYYTTNELYQLKEEEGWFKLIAFSCGVYGVSGQVLQGANSGEIYKITSRTNAIFILY